MDSQRKLWIFWRRSLSSNIAIAMQWHLDNNVKNKYCCVTTLKTALLTLPYSSSIFPSGKRKKKKSLLSSPVFAVPWLPLCRWRWAACRMQGKAKASAAGRWGSCLCCPAPPLGLFIPCDFSIKQVVTKSCSGLSDCAPPCLPCCYWRTANVTIYLLVKIVHHCAKNQAKKYRRHGKRTEIY